jgi:hypothetical protein
MEKNVHIDWLETKNTEQNHNTADLLFSTNSLDKLEKNSDYNNYKVENKS